MPTKSIFREFQSHSLECEVPCAGAVYVSTAKLSTLQFDIEVGCLIRVKTD